MARTVNLSHRESLADAVATQFVATGTARASLRELAQVVGASARMLVHHFGTREHLVDAALDVARARQLAAATAAIVPGPDAVHALAAVWEWFEHSDTRRYFALFTEVAADERIRPGADRRFGGRLGTDWESLFEGLFRADTRFTDDAPQLALLVIGVLRGFALDLDTAADLDAHRRAFTTLVALVASQAERR